MKQGDVIFITNKHGDESIAIYSHDIIDNRIELYVRYLYDSNILWFATDTTYTKIRLATEEEKIKLYDALCVHFSEEYDKEWTKHFTDSSYHDVLDYLLDAFNIEIDETLCTTSWYPSFVDDIQNYIWDKMCEFMGQPNKTGIVEVEEGSGDKMISLNRAAKWLEKNLDWYMRHVYITENMDTTDIVSDFCIAMGE